MSDTYVLVHGAWHTGSGSNLPRTTFASGAIPCIARPSPAIVLATTGVASG